MFFLTHPYVYTYIQAHTQINIHTCGKKSCNTNAVSANDREINYLALLVQWVLKFNGFYYSLTSFSLKM